MTNYVRRPRQVIGLIYILAYIAVFITFVIVRSDDRSWLVDIKLTLLVTLWFILSISVKFSMFMNRIIELLNLLAFVAFMSIGFVYLPHPGPPRAIENLCYYLYLIGGPLCDLFDFFIEAAAKCKEDLL